MFRGGRWRQSLGTSLASSAACPNTTSSATLTFPITSYGSAGGDNSAYRFYNGKGPVPPCSAATAHTLHHNQHYANSSNSCAAAASSTSILWSSSSCHRAHSSQFQSPTSLSVPFAVNSGGSSNSIATTGCNSRSNCASSSTGNINSNNSISSSSGSCGGYGSSSNNNDVFGCKNHRVGRKTHHDTRTTTAAATTTTTANTTATTTNSTISTTTKNISSGVSFDAVTTLPLSSPSVMEANASRALALSVPPGLPHHQHSNGSGATTLYQDGVREHQSGTTPNNDGKYFNARLLSHFGASSKVGSVLCHGTQTTQHRGGIQQRGHTQLHSFQDHSTQPHKTQFHGAHPYSSQPHGTQTHSTQPHGSQLHSTHPQSHSAHLLGTHLQSTVEIGTQPQSPQPHSPKPHSPPPHKGTPSCDSCTAGRSFALCRCGRFSWRRKRHVSEETGEDSEGGAGPHPYYGGEGSRQGRGSCSSPPIFSKNSLGRVSPGHDLGYHTLVPRQTPSPPPLPISSSSSTPTTTTTTTSTTTTTHWPDLRASPFPPSLDLSALTSCPARSSPRPQLPSIPPTTSLDSTELLLAAAVKGKRSARQAPFDKLTDDLLVKVFSFLPTPSLCVVSRVCRRWHLAAWQPCLWTAVSLAGDALHADRALKQITRLLARDGEGTLQIQKVSVNGSPRLTDRGLSLLGRRCPELRHLDVKGCVSVTNVGVFELVTQCVNLEHLDVTGCHQITCIQVSQAGCTEAVDSLLHSRQLYLQYLDMTDCYGLHDPGLKIIVRNCPQLLHLYLRRCLNITDVGIKHIASYCQMLREVSVSDCIQVTDFGMYELAKLGPNLRYLSVAKCDQISDAGIKQIARHCYKLRYLNVRGCEAVSDDSMEMVARSCPRLRALDIGKCDVTDNGMKLISENCPNLKKLSVKSCDMVTDLGIQFIAYYCRGLQQLNIQDCQVTLDGYRTVKKFCRRCIIEHTNPGFF